MLETQVMNEILTQPGGTPVRMTVRLPEQVRRLLKMQAARNGITLQALVQAALSDRLAQSDVCNHQKITL